MTIILRLVKIRTYKCFITIEFIHAKEMIVLKVVAVNIEWYFIMDALLWA